MKYLTILLLLVLTSCASEENLIECNCSHLNNVKRGQPVLLDEETFYYKYTDITCSSEVSAITQNGKVTLVVHCTLLKVK